MKRWCGSALLAWTILCLLLLSLGSHVGLNYQIPLDCSEANWDGFREFTSNSPPTWVVVSTPFHDTVPISVPSAHLGSALIIQGPSPPGWASSGPPDPVKGPTRAKASALNNKHVPYLWEIAGSKSAKLRNQGFATAFS
jgi:hypothetical protein